MERGKKERKMKTGGLKKDEIERERQKPETYVKTKGKDLREKRGNKIKRK